MALSYAVWLVTAEFLWLVVFAVILGTSYGSRIAAVPAVLIEFFGLENLGTRSSRRDNEMTRPSCATMTTRRSCLCRDTGLLILIVAAFPIQFVALQAGFVWPTRQELAISR